MAKINKLLRTLPVLIYWIFALLVLFEIGVRFWGYSQHYIYDPIYKEFDKSKDLPYIHKPNLKNARGRGLTNVNTDVLGLRSKMPGIKYGPKKENDYRIVILGDSVAFGEGVKMEEDTFAQVLEDILNTKQHSFVVKVFNYGVSAYSIKNMVATLQYRALDVEPDLVLMTVIPDDFRIDRTVVVDKFGYTFNKRLSGFMNKDSAIKRLLREVHLVYLLRDIKHFYIDRIRNTKDMGPSDSLDDYAYIVKFKEISTQHGLLYAVVLLPDLAEDFKSLLAKLNQDEIVSIDLSFLKNEFTPREFMASKFDRHPSAIVHRRIARMLSEYIISNQLIPKK